MNSNVLTAGIGCALMMLAILRFDDQIQTSPQFIISLSIAALFLTIIDAYDFVSEEIGRIIRKRENEKKKSPETPREKAKKALRKRTGAIKILMYFLASLSMIALPQTTYLQQLDKPTLDRISDASLLLSLGLVIYLIGAKGIVETKEQINAVLDIHESQESTSLAQSQSAKEADNDENHC